jgi:hypothetical protein
MRRVRKAVDEESRGTSPEGKIHNHSWHAKKLPRVAGTGLISGMNAWLFKPNRFPLLPSI